MRSQLAGLHGVQVPRVRHAPSVRANSWDEVVDLAASYGLILDPWQENVLEAALGERSDRQWATPRVGVAVPRQNGKGALIEARELAGLLLFGEQTLIHSAHEQKTARIGFDRIAAYFENFDDLRKKVKTIAGAGGREYIELLTGQSLRFLARSKGSGRGFSADCLLLDEAQILSDRVWAAILPTMSARPNSQVWLFGTPPTPQDEGDVFKRLRLAGHEGKDHRLCWVEWSAEREDDLDSSEMWAKANPALGIRISAQAVHDERVSMDDETFARERLGVWEGSTNTSVIDSVVWEHAAAPSSMAIDRLALAVDVAPDRSVAAVALAGQRHDGLWHVELDEHRAGIGWVVPWVVERCGRNTIRAVVIEAASPAASLIDDFAKAKVKVSAVSARELANACGQFYDGVVEEWLKHTDQPQVNVALSVARKRALGDAWAWNRKSATSDITPLMAETLALWGAQSTAVKRPGGQRRMSGRRASVL